MQKLLIFTILILSLSCAKQPLGAGEDPKPVPPVIELGKGSVVRNGELWEPKFMTHKSPYKFNPEVFAISANMMIPPPVFLLQSLAIHNIPTQKGKYPLQIIRLEHLRKGIPIAGYGLTHESDQPAADFHIDTTRNDHWVEIIRYDSTSRTIEGRFEMHLLLKPGGLFIRNTPDKFDFTDGKFHLQIPK